MLRDETKGKNGLLGSNWVSWTLGAVKRRKAQRAIASNGGLGVTTIAAAGSAAGPSRPTSTSISISEKEKESLSRGRPPAISAANSFRSTTSTRAPSVTSGQGRDGSPAKNRTSDEDSSLAGRIKEEGEDDMEVFMDRLRTMKGYAPMRDGQNEWEMLESELFSHSHLS